MSYGTCKICKCTDDIACNHPDHGNCWWITDDHELCSHCYHEDIRIDPATQRQIASTPSIIDITLWEVECARCGDVHKWGERLDVTYGDGITCFWCPICGDEDYIKVRKS